MRKHRFSAIGLVVFALIIAQVAIGQAAMGPLRPQGVAMADTDAPKPIKVMVGEKGLPQFQIAPPASFAARPKTATFTIQYLETGETNYFDDVCIGWPTEAKEAFTYAANIWGTLINSPLPIKISACWANMGTGGILGHGGARSYYMDFSGAPQASTFYPVAIANALYGRDLNSDTEEMVIAYNAEFTDWYYGTGTCPADKIDFIQVIMHEMCHGLGFLGSMSVSSGQGYWGLSDGSSYYPVIYDRYTENASGTKLINYTRGSASLYNQLVSTNVYFNGANANSANGGSKVKLYAPSTWSSGSSYAHLDEIFNGTANAMMTYSVSYGETIHNPGPVTLGILKDNGWTQATFTNAVLNDYDADGKSDLAVYRDGYWSIFTMAGNVLFYNEGPWGGAGWTTVPGDYDGDSRSDLAVYRDGLWSISTIAGSVLFYNEGPWGGAGWTPVPGDYDGDSKSDLAVYRNGYWSIFTMAGNVLFYESGPWGGSSWTPVR